MARNKSLYLVVFMCFIYVCRVIRVWTVIGPYLLGIHLIPYSGWHIVAVIAFTYTEMITIVSGDGRFPVHVSVMGIQHFQCRLTYCHTIALTNIAIRHGQSK